jgi:hypothetical protein
MNQRVECPTAADVEKALANGDIAIVRFSGWITVRGSAHVEARGSAHVVAYDSAHVVARGSAHVVAYDSAHVVARWSAHVEAYDSAHVVAYDSAHVEARGSAHVEAYDSAHVVASKLVAVHRHGNTPMVKGGVIIQVDPPKTAAEWLDLYGIEVVDGIAVLYKALDDRFVSPRGMSYAPGTTPSAPDWDGGKAECGGGLHFSPSPFMAKEFAPEARRFAACPVLVSEIVVHENATYPNKVKAPRCIAPVWEVDAYGNEVRA